MTTTMTMVMMVRKMTTRRRVMRTLYDIYFQYFLLKVMVLIEIGVHLTE